MRVLRFVLCVVIAVGTFAGALRLSTVHVETVEIAWIDPLSELTGVPGQN